MAFAITSPATANISDTQANVAIAWSGATIGTNWYIFLALRINGVNIATYSGPATATGSQTLAIASNAQAIYNAAKGHGLSGAVEIYAENYLDDAPYTLHVFTLTGALTVNYRIKSLSLTKPSTSSPWNMDVTTGNTLTSSWTRTNSAFLARLKGWVWNGSDWTLVFNRYGYTTSSNTDIDVLGYHDAIVAAMNGVSPRNFKLQIITQFDDGTADYLDLSYTESEVSGNYTKRTASYGVTKTFITLSTVSIGNFELLPIDMSVPFNLITYGSYPHTVRLYLKKPDGTPVLIKTLSLSAGVTSGTFAIGSTERDIILNALPTVTYATTYAEVDTDTYGTTSSSGTATTLSLNADFKPVLGTITWAEAMAYVKTALGYGAGTPLFLTSKSKVTFTIPITNAVGASTVSVRVQFAGTDKSQASSPLTTDFLITAGSLQTTITVLDSRGRSSSATTSAIVVRAYVYPKVDKFEVFRSDAVSGAYAPLGTYLRCVVKGTATTVKALDGTTEKNWVKYKIDYRVKATGSYSNNSAVVPGGLTFGELTTSGVSGFLVANAYDIRVRVFDAFYDLDGDASTLEDTDDYAESITILPIGEVSMMLGRKVMSVGKVWQHGALDIGGDIQADGDIYANGVKLGGGMSASDILTAIKTVDGAGSGLDADLLDGNSSAFFAPVANPTFTGLVATAGQVKFPSVQSASADANTLDDYEENTFVPTIIGTTSAGTGTYTTQGGVYTKIGNLVFFRIGLSWTAHNGSGNMRVSGLPFTSANDLSSPLSIFHANIALTAAQTMQCFVIMNSNQIDIRQVEDGASGNVTMDTAGTLFLSGFYAV